MATLALVLVLGLFALACSSPPEVAPLEVVVLDRWPQHGRCANRDAVPLDCLPPTAALCLASPDLAVCGQQFEVQPAD